MRKRADESVEKRGNIVVATLRKERYGKTTRTSGNSSIVEHREWSTNRRWKCRTFPAVGVAYFIPQGPRGHRSYYRWNRRNIGKLPEETYSAVFRVLPREERDVHQQSTAPQSAISCVILKRYSGATRTHVPKIRFGENEIGGEKDCRLR